MWSHKVPYVNGFVRTWTDTPHNPEVRGVSQNYYTTTYTLRRVATVKNYFGIATGHAKTHAEVIGMGPVVSQWSREMLRVCVCRVS